MNNTKRVLVDAGHGGTDPGAVAGGLNEKDVNLDVAMAVGWFLAARGMLVSYTRTKDIFLSLAERRRLIDTWRPDACVSIHCNAIDDDPKTVQDERKFVHGFEIYYRDATDELLARKVEHYLALASLKNKGVFQDVARLGKHLAMLNNLPVPQILVELAYLTHQNDADYIACHKHDVADLIAHGIQDFLVEPIQRHAGS